MKEFLAAKINQDDEARDEVKKQEKEEKNKYNEKEKYSEKEEYVENKWVIAENEEGGGHSVERFENDKEAIEDEEEEGYGVELLGNDEDVIDEEEGYSVEILDKEVIEDKEDFLLPNTFLSPPLGDIVVMKTSFNSENYEFTSNVFMQCECFSFEGHHIITMTKVSSV